ncbi:uncharacterized protein PRCAT00003499001 [Priceomyces carsonii]|uniref:uncharacterized protein n=1 Tax=Priceomyces carsonii TaxID=28549 RepID=UPI002EDA0561|nr:unnamed protein product [Priceomyces carsonii]
MIKETNLNQVTEIKSLKKFQEVLNQKGIVVLDFFSPTCKPCEIILPLYSKLAEKYDGVGFYKINGCENQGVFMQSSLDVVWWPTLVILKDSKEVWRGKIPNPPLQHPMKELELALTKELNIRNEALE